MTKKLIVAVALMILMSGTAACSFVRAADTPEPELVKVSIPPEVAAPCLKVDPNKDVPPNPATDSQAEVYVRKLKDGIEICQTVVRDNTASGS